MSYSNDDFDENMKSYVFAQSNHLLQVNDWKGVSKSGTIKACLESRKNEEGRDKKTSLKLANNNRIK